jgi:hypothetical protein
MMNGRNMAHSEVTEESSAACGLKKKLYDELDT